MECKSELAASQLEKERKSQCELLELEKPGETRRFERRIDRKAMKRRGFRCFFGASSAQEDLCFEARGGAAALGTALRGGRRGCMILVRFMRLIAIR